MLQFTFHRLYRKEAQRKALLSIDLESHINIPLICYSPPILRPPVLPYRQCSPRNVCTTGTTEHHVQPFCMHVIKLCTPHNLPLQNMQYIRETIFLDFAYWK